MLTTMSSSSSSSNGGAVMPSWHYGGGSGAVGMTIAGASNSLCGASSGVGNSGTNTNNSSSGGSSNNNANTCNNGNVVSSGLSVGNGTSCNRLGVSTTPTVGSVCSGAGSGGVPNAGGSDLMSLTRQIKCEYSPTGPMYGSSATPDLEPETRARANTWHAERKKPDRQMLESLLEEEDTDDSPPDSLSGVKPESLSPLGEVMGSSPLSGSGHGPDANKKISRRNAWGNLSYADLITKAIECSPEKRLTLSQIYDWMVQNVPYFKDKGDTTSSAGWKNSIRHNLSLHTRFMRVQNESSGKSSWWVINPDASKSGKSPRRRAASIDAKNFERKRGRVKKRLSVLQGAGSADFSTSLGSRNASTSSLNAATLSAAGTLCDGVSSSSSTTGHHDYPRPLHFGSSTTASLESRLQHLASNDPCWSEAPASSSLGTGGSGSGAYDMDLDSPVGQSKMIGGGNTSSGNSVTDSYHHLFGAPQAGASSVNHIRSSNSASSYGMQQQGQPSSASAATTPPHLTTTYLQLQGSYHLAVANTPNHHHGSPGSTTQATPAAMGTFHSFHSSPFGQHPTAAAAAPPTLSYMPSYHLQSMSYGSSNSNVMTDGMQNSSNVGNMMSLGSLLQQSSSGPSSTTLSSSASPQVKSYSNLQPVTMNSFKQPQAGTPVYGSSGSSNGVMGTIHHHHANNHPQQPQMNQQQHLVGLAGNPGSLTATPPSNSSGLPQDLDFFEPFGSSGMVSGSNSGLLGLGSANGSASGGNGSGYFVDIADMDSTIGKDLCADSSLDVNLEFESLLSSSQMS